VFGSLRCDCGQQLDESLRRIHEAGCGMLVYLRQEGRGIGIENKLKAYALQDQGLDTVDANVALGLPIDARTYEPAVAYLQHRRVCRCVLLTNNPDKVRALEAHGLTVTRAPLRSAGHEACQGYLETKRLRLGQDC
jgi:GTP cyclohydrolase II